MLDAILRHTFRIKIGLFISIILTLLTGLLIFTHKIYIQNTDNIEEQIIYIFNISINNWFTILSFFTAVLGVIWAFFQFDKSRMLQQQEKASEIAKDFANNFIEKTALICDTLMSNEEFKKMIVKVVKSHKLNQFTTCEITNILNDKQCFNKCDKIIRSRKTQKKYKQFLKSKYNSAERSKFNSNFSVLVENTLNQLEAICINISSKAAGSQFIYDSLHQSFLYTVEVLSINISKNNDNNFDKYFVNIIEVYNMWNYQKNKDIQKFKKTQAKINSLKNKVRQEIYKLLTKKSKTV